MTSTSNTDTQARGTTSTRRAAAAMAAVLGAGAVATAVAAPADAAPSYMHTWERVAQCESSGDWKINTGNGYYGGVQFSSGTWAAYGGHKYAGQANRASKREQIQVARRVLHAQGPHAWPVCGPRAGLTRSSGGSTGAALPASDETLTRRAKAHKSATHKSKAHKSATHKAKHRKATHRTYVVKHGDTLSGIVRKLHLHMTWHKLAKANAATLHNPNDLRIGQVLRIPS